MYTGMRRRVHVRPQVSKRNHTYSLTAHRQRNNCLELVLAMAILRAKLLAEV